MKWCLSKMKPIGCEQDEWCSMRNCGHCQVAYEYSLHWARIESYICWEWKIISHPGRDFMNNILRTITVMKNWVLFAQRKGGGAEKDSRWEYAYWECTGWRVENKEHNLEENHRRRCIRKTDYHCIWHENDMISRSHEPLENSHGYQTRMRGEWLDLRR